MIVVSAPSGSGKTTIVKAILEANPRVSFSISACSRPPRNNEKDGIDYYFLGKEDFRKKIDEDAFVEWEEVYNGHYYGTLKSEVERIWQQGRHVIFDVDVKGGLNIKNQFGDRCLALFIKAPSVEELEKRLRNRSTDGEETIRERLAKAAYEMTFAKLFDHIIVNDNLEIAIEKTQKTVSDFLAENP
ncbi:MAG: guanylate kinase [Bacteroidales bacterium]